MTNFEKIKAKINSMTIEQFVKFCSCRGGKLNSLCKYINSCPYPHTDVSCDECIVRWLEREIERLERIEKNENI